MDRWVLYDKAETTGTQKSCFLRSYSSHGLGVVDQTSLNEMFTCIKVKRGEGNCPGNGANSEPLEFIENDKNCSSKWLLQEKHVFFQ